MRRGGLHVSAYRLAAAVSVRCCGGPATGVTQEESPQELDYTEATLQELHDLAHAVAAHGRRRYGSSADMRRGDALVDEWIWSIRQLMTPTIVETALQQCRYGKFESAVLPTDAAATGPPAAGDALTASARPAVTPLRAFERGDSRPYSKSPTTTSETSSLRDACFRPRTKVTRVTRETLFHPVASAYVHEPFQLKVLRADCPDDLLASARAHRSRAFIRTMRTLCRPGLRLQERHREAVADILFKALPQRAF